MKYIECVHFTCKTSLIIPHIRGCTFSRMISADNCTRETLILIRTDLAPGDVIRGYRFPTDDFICNPWISADLGPLLDTSRFNSKGFVETSQEFGIECRSTI